MTYDVAIIGAGPAGITAGLYTQRGNLKTLIIHNGKTSLENANKIENKILRQIASQIEDATMKFFDSLNDILYLDSKNKK